MKIVSFFLSILFCLFTICGQSQNYSSKEIVQKSIKYHDPDDNWKRFNDTLFFKQELPDDLIRFRKVWLNNDNQKFQFWAMHEDGTIMYKVYQDSASVFWNDSENIPEPIIQKYRLSKERAIMYRNYYLYLYGLPMKLLDYGAIIHKGVEKLDFNGKERIKVKVTYLPEVGNDTWYFYFDPNSFALTAYQFFHEEKDKDGEYILLEGIKELGGMRFPKIRSWYYNNTADFLARDILQD